MNANATKTVEAAANTCRCSAFLDTTTGERLVCGRTTTRTFAPGHDARLKGFLIKAGRENHGVIVDGSDEEMDARQAASPFGFYAQVLAGVAKGPRKAARAAKKAAPKIVTAKVGRWFYEGVVLAAGDGQPVFRYTNKKSEVVEVLKFTLV